MDRKNTPSSGRGRRLQVGNSPPLLAFDATHIVFIKECQDILKTRLSDSLLAFINDLTGIEVQVFWQPPLESRWSGEPAMLCPSARRIVNAGGEVTVVCRTCLGEHWDPSMLRNGARGRFIGACEDTAFCAGIYWTDVCLVLLVIQERIEPEPDTRVDPGEARLHEPESPPRHLTSFDHAESLLQLLVHDLEATLQAHLARRELEMAERRLRQFEAGSPSTADEAVSHLFGVASAEPAHHPPGGHARQVVQAMLEFVREHYHRPMALKEVAGYLGMNANYLSGLFHRSTGTTFHRYLHAIRMTKAEELLRDPRVRICEVANAVGYTSPNHFRSAFKACEKLSPSAWTESQPRPEPQT